MILDWGSFPWLEFIKRGRVAVDCGNVLGLLEGRCEPREPGRMDLERWARVAAGFCERGAVAHPSTSLELRVIAAARFSDVWLILATSSPPAISRFPEYTALIVGGGPVYVVRRGDARFYTSVLRLVSRAAALSTDEPLLRRARSRRQALHGCLQPHAARNGHESANPPRTGWGLSAPRPE